MIIPDDIYEVVLVMHTRHEKALRTINEHLQDKGRVPRSMFAALIESETDLGALLIAICDANIEEAKPKPT